MTHTGCEAQPALTCSVALEEFKVHRLAQTLGRSPTVSFQRFHVGCNEVKTVGNRQQIHNCLKMLTYCTWQLFYL